MDPSAGQCQYSDSTNLPQFSMTFFKRLLPGILLLVVGLHPALAQDNYNAFELRRQDNWSDLQFRDMNGDGRRDVVVSHYRSDLGRELHIYHQQPDGNFSAEPQRIEIKTEIIAVDFAELRPEPGLELVLFATNGVFSLSTASEGYAGNLQLLYEWDYLATIPDLERVRFVNYVTDLNNDGHADMLVPGDDRYAVLIGKPDEQFELAAEFSTLNPGMTDIQRQNFAADLDANLGISAERGVVVEINIETPTAFQGFVEQWQQAQQPDQLMNSEQWMPTATLARLNDDELPDIAYVNAGDDGQGRFNIHFQGPDLAYGAAPDWSRSFDSRGDLELVDLDGDSLDDLLRLRGEGDNWTLYLHRNRGGEFDLQNPDQIMRFSGYDLDINLVDLGDGAPVLNASYYTIPVVDAIRNASINRIQLLYAPQTGEGGLFSRRPDSRLEENFSADNVRGLSEQMSLRFDVDGDGRNDALYISDNGTLAAKQIDARLQIAAEPFWEYVSPLSVFEFEVMHLNEDSRPDLMLRHGTSTTLLVARP